MGLQAEPELKGQLDLLDLVEPLVQQVQPDRLVQREQRARLVRRVLLVLRVV